MKIKNTICSSLALLLLVGLSVCYGASGQSQNDAVAVVLDILKSGDQEMQAVAITMVKGMPGTEVTKALAEELPKLSPASQVQLLSVLGDRGDVAAMPAITSAVKAENPAVRIAALRALGQLGDDSSVGLLAGTAAEQKGEEQKTARDSLYRLRGSKVDQAIVAGIATSEPRTKVELISAVGERNIRTAVGTLLETAKDSDRKVRTESLKVLKVVAGPEQLPALIKLLVNAQSSSDRAEAQKTVAAVAHKIEDKNHQAEAVLAVLPSVKEVQGRCSLLGVLGKIGDGNALPALTEALKDKDAEIQTAAIRALAEWPTAGPVVDLMKVAESSQNKVHRILALRGFVRLLGLESSRPAEQTIGMYKKAMSLAQDAGEKRRVLSGLGNTKSLEALQMAQEYLGDKALSNEAAVAMIRIAAAISPEFPEQAKTAIERVKKIAASDSLREQAQEAINQIEGSDKTDGSGEEKN